MLIYERNKRCKFKGLEIILTHLTKRIFKNFKINLCLNINSKIIVTKNWVNRYICN